MRTTSLASVGRIRRSTTLASMMRLLPENPNILTPEYQMDYISGVRMFGFSGRSRIMEARVVDLRILPTEAREVVRIYRDSVLPVARRQQGFKGALLLTDDETGVGISISLWETEEDREEGEANGFYQQQIKKFSELLTETPVRKHYNVGVLHYDASVLA